ncbi:Hypothetical_protein [Hexamita inflata]|uniref:Hypothetical_protein n=1 Tax=Hexamita inflata TaxID=28002 RepID=A0AA86Q4F0_9EUKA|nr:Hypothetical protein HINF_LOCUS37163 [Hexamita inflata]
MQIHLSNTKIFHTITYQTKKFQQQTSQNSTTKYSQLGAVHSELQRRLMKQDNVEIRLGLFSGLVTFRLGFLASLGFVLLGAFSSIFFVGSVYIYIYIHTKPV